METLCAYSQDLHEVKVNLLDRGFRKTAEILDNLPKAHAEALVGAAFSIQRYRDTTRGIKKSMTLWQKIRAEMNMDLAEFVKAVNEFHSRDVSAQSKAWSEKTDAFARETLRPDHYAQWKQGSSFIAAIDKKFPKPSLRQITVEGVRLIESDRPYREARRPESIETYERFFEHVTGFKLSWEELLSELTSRDPRAKKVPESEKKWPKKRAALAAEKTDASEGPADISLVPGDLISGSALAEL